MAKAPPTRPSLLLRLRDARDGVAWSEFVEVYAPLVYGYARKQGLQDADAADVTQEVLRADGGGWPGAETGGGGARPHGRRGVHRQESGAGPAARARSRLAG